MPEGQLEDGQRIDSNRYVTIYPSIASQACLFRLFGQTQIRFRRLPAARKERLRFNVGHRARDDDVIPLLPIHRGRHFVLGHEAAVA